MAYQTVFRRFELKYLITPEQKAADLEAVAPHMAPDQYGHTTIRNIYFDTPDHRIIRHSIGKPVYKEKLRLRSYRRADSGSEVFVELKKKFDHVVYKRRLAMKEAEALDWLAGRAHCADDTLTIEQGIIAISESCEGLESLHIQVCGGDISLISCDDGINAAGGTGASGTAQTFSGNTQDIIAVSLAGAASAGTELVLTDTTGSEVIRFTPNLSYAVVILSSPDMVSGESYTITVCTASGTFEPY